MCAFRREAILFFPSPERKNIFQVLLLCRCISNRHTKKNERKEIMVSREMHTKKWGGKRRSFEMISRQKRTEENEGPTRSFSPVLLLFLPSLLGKQQKITNIRRSRVSRTFRFTFETQKRKKNDFTLLFCLFPFAFKFQANNHTKNTTE